MRSYGGNIRYRDPRNRGLDGHIRGIWHVLFYGILRLLR
jgi:hypothetical protein